MLLKLNRKEFARIFKGATAKGRSKSFGKIASRILTRNLVARPWNVERARTGTAKGRQTTRQRSSSRRD